MYDLTVQQEEVVRWCLIFDKSVFIYIISKVFFCPFECHQIPALFSIKVLDLKLEYVQTTQSHNSLIWLIKVPPRGNRFVFSSVILCACDLYCMCTAAFALVTISHQRPFQSGWDHVTCVESQLIRLHFAMFALPVNSSLKPADLTCVSEGKTCLHWQQVWMFLLQK